MLKGQAKTNYQREYMRKRRAGLTGSNTGWSNILHRTAGATPEESGYPEGQVEVHKGPQGQVLWRLRGYYDLPNDILCYNASHELKRKPLLDELKAMFPGGEA